jgi:hypothetical protein
MEENRNQPGQEQQSGLESGNAGKNKTVGAPGSNVPDYGRSRQKEENETRGNRQDEQDKEIPLGNEETIGNP